MYKIKRIVIISLLLSLVIFNITYTYVGGWNVEENLNSFAVSDLLISSKENINRESQSSNQDAITDDVVEAISTMQGVEDIGFTYVYSAKTSNIYGVSENLLSLLPTHPLDRNPIRSTLTKEMIAKFQTGTYVLVTEYTEEQQGRYQVGETVVLDFENGNSKEYEILSLGDIPYPIDRRLTSYGSLKFILPEEEFLKQVENDLPLTMTINIEDTYLGEAEYFIHNYIETSAPTLAYESKLIYTKEIERMQFTIIMVGNALGILFGFIGAMNFVNIMITNITQRKTELLILHSIGMTHRQINAMLIWEGVFYGGSTMILFMMLGSFITYYVVNAFSGLLVTSSYHYEWMPIIVSAMGLLTLSVLTPVLVYQWSRGRRNSEFEL